MAKEFGKGEMGEGGIQSVCECQSTSLMGESWLLWPTASESQKLFLRKTFNLNTKYVLALTAWQFQ